MKVDIGFWNIDGEYIQDIQDVDNKELEVDTMDELKDVMDELDSFTNRYTETYSVIYDDEWGKHLTEVECIPEDGIKELNRLIRRLQDILEM